MLSNPILFVSQKLIVIRIISVCVPFLSPRAGVVLESGDKYSFNEDGSEMTIMEVAKLDEGEYTCIAKNKAGESEQELSLRVFGEGLLSLGADR